MMQHTPGNWTQRTPHVEVLAIKHSKGHVCHPLQRSNVLTLALLKGTDGDPL